MAEESSELAPDALLLVYITAPDRDTAINLGRMLVSRHLAACVNVVPKITSIFQWSGEIQVDNECLLLVKTVAGRWSALHDAVKAAHPYKVPCITAVPLARAHDPFAVWVRAETAG